MNSEWTIGRKLGLGFGVIVACTLAISALAVWTLDSVVASKDRVIADNSQRLVDVSRLDGLLEVKSSAVRAYFLLKEDRFLDQMHTARADAQAILVRMRGLAPGGEERDLLDQVASLEVAQQAAVDRTIDIRKASATADSAVRAFEDEVLARRAALTAALEKLRSLETATLESAKQAASMLATTTAHWLLALTLLCLAIAAVTAAVLSRGLAAQIGVAVHHIQSSSTELQAAASQQASGSREHASAMSEITTTMRELLATSHQIAESAQRVSRAADQTAEGARSGEATLRRSSDALAEIKAQVDQIVGQMLALGKRTGQAGAILDIINELAEQTNILAINAMIEAAGAGEQGRRFGVVAEEVRRLADRVGGSTQEIRQIVDEIRASVNTTVLTTEGGAKAAEAGTRQFTELATVFRSIATQVQTTTEMAREIELSTKQQATAVDQVNVAIANVAQAARESEASAGQTLQTSSLLTTLSRDLAHIVTAPGNVLAESAGGPA